MKAFMLSAFACLLCTAAQAATYRLPTQLEVAGYQCGAADPEPYVITSTDPATGYQQGRVWAWASCPGPRGTGNSYHWGCASAVWDGNDVLLSYELEYRGYGRVLAASSGCLAP